jgi:hypothetical protein
MATNSSIKESNPPWTSTVDRGERPDDATRYAGRNPPA